LINNAAQTVRRPAGFYTHMMANELPINELPKQAQELLQDHLNCLEELKVLTLLPRLMKTCLLLGTDQNLVLV
jgi:hypothetical protein